MYRADILKQVDQEIRDLVEALNDAGLHTDWCCSGEPGHMLIRPTIQMRTYGDLTPNGLKTLERERAAIEKVMQSFSVGNYWLLLNMAYGAYNTHGGEPTWILMIPGRFDLTTALPVAYSAAYQSDVDIDAEYASVFQKNGQ